LGFYNLNKQYIQISLKTLQTSLTKEFIDY